jgi:hypothetical protein
LLADARARQREDLLAATERALEAIAGQVARRTKRPLSAAEIGHKVGRVIARCKPAPADGPGVAKHVELDIADGRFAYRRRPETIQAEAALDGLYLIRTSEPAARLSPQDTVRAYEGLAQVEQLFRSLKGLDILIRPIRHREERRVRAHIFLCLLAGYLEWHLRRAWAPLLFDDRTLEQERKTRHPVAPAKPTPEAKRKKAQRRTNDGLALHSLETLIAELATRCRNTCRIKSDPTAPAFPQLTEPTQTQRRAQELIHAFPVSGHA